MTIFPIDFVTIVVKSTPCENPIGTLVHTIEISRPEQYAHAFHMPICRYAALYPEVTVSLANIQSVENVGNANLGELLEVLEKVILQIALHEVRAIISTPEEMLALFEFLTDFSRDDIINFNTLRARVLSKELAAELTRTQ